MKTTIELPEALQRELEARAASEGRTVPELMLTLLRHALAEPARPSRAAHRSQPPTVEAGGPLPLTDASNAGLFELLDSGG
ncbi:MAG: hypothetical protein AMXMBFR66_00530 [Pseudomonadota bacterium]|nr:ribbon-helix-helix protein, CopG family [Rubrivivax sp.]